MGTAHASLRRRASARVKTASPHDMFCWLAWIMLPLAGMIWIGLQYRHHWFRYDEWQMIERSMGSWNGLFEGHQGHLMVSNYLVYRAQRVLFGLENHRLVYLTFLISLGALNISLGALLRRLGLPTLLALLAATMITYFGPGAQNISDEFIGGPTFALAFSVAAAVVALRIAKTRNAAIGIAVLMVLAVLTDSGIAILGIAYVGVLVVALWPKGLATVALVPPLLAHLAWFAFGDQWINIGTTFEKTWAFAWHLFTLSAGGLVGGGETPSSTGVLPTQRVLPLSGTTAGLLVLALGAACVWLGVRRHRLNRPIVASLIGGMATAALSVGLVAKTRAWLILPDSLPGTRYVQWTAVFLLLALAPVVIAALRPANARFLKVFWTASGVALIAIFVVNLNSWRPMQDFGATWSSNTRVAVQQTVSVLTEGCPRGTRVTAEAEVTLQISVGLVRAVLADGALTPEFGIPPSPELRDQVCQPVKSLRNRSGHLAG